MSMRVINGKFSIAASVAAAAFVLGVGGATARAQDERTPDLGAARPTAHLVAPEGRLVVDEGRLFGHLPGGAYDVALTPERAQGQGAFGEIDLRLHKVSAGYRLDGIWNGGPVSFVVTPEAIRGTAARPISARTRGFVTCSYDVVKQTGRAEYAGREDCRSGAPNPVRFAVPTATPVEDERAAVLVIAYLLSPIG